MKCKEEWKDIEGFEGLYQISTFGRVKSLVGWCGNKNIKKYIHREKILSKQKDGESQSHYDEYTKNINGFDFLEDDFI